MFRRIREDSDPIEILTSLLEKLRALKNIASVERNKFDKDTAEKRSGAALQRQDISFDGKFGDFAYHSQTLKLSREKIRNIDSELKKMMSRFSSNYYGAITNSPELLEHCQSTRQCSKNVVLYFDHVMSNPAMFQVYEAYDRLEDLVTDLENWSSVVEQMIEDSNYTDQLLSR